MLLYSSTVPIEDLHNKTYANFYKTYVDFYKTYAGIVVFAPSN